MQLRFIHFVDELTPIHIIFVKYFLRYGIYVQGISKYEQLYEIMCDQLQIDISKDLFKLIILDLSTRNLLRVSPDIEDFDYVYKSYSLALQKENSGPMIRIFPMEKIL